MAMNRDLIGRSYSPATFEVEQEAMIRYAEATNETNARLLDPGIEGGLIAPPLFPVVYHGRVLGRAISDPELGIEFHRALHGEQDMSFHRPIRDGDVITTTPSIESIADKGTGETLAIRLRSLNQAGELVEETLFTLFVRGRPKQQAPGEKKPAAKTKRAAIDGPAGDPLASVSQQLDTDQTYRYSEASGDNVKIHLDPKVAKKAGFPGIIGHGLCTMAFTSRAIVESVCGGDPARLKRLALRFALPVIPGEIITTRVWAAGEGEYTFETRDPRDKLVISDGRAVVASS